MVDLIYKLVCGRCSAINFILSDTPQVTWFCRECDVFSWTALPTKSNCRTLIDMPQQTESLIYIHLDQMQPGEVLSESYKAGTYNPAEDPVRKDEIRWKPIGSLLPESPSFGEDLEVADG